MSGAMLQAAPPGAPAMDTRTHALLNARLLPILLRLAWPNVLVMLAQASTGLIETWWVSRLGTDALAGMAIVFPGVMLMQTFSAGAMGGGIASSVARALGSGRRTTADQLVLHAIVINVAIGAAFSVLALIFGPQLYRAMGGSGASLDAALRYSNVVFAGTVLLWLMNALASVVRGTGNMLVPALVVCGGVVLLVPLSPCLIFGIGPFPAFGIAGGGIALVAFYAGGTAVLLWYILSGRSVVRFSRTRLSWPLFRDILRVGAVAAITTLQTNITMAVVTSLVGRRFGSDAVAGFGTGARVEYLLIPLVFGLGAPLVALVGTNIGARQPQRALHVALLGGALAFVLTETIGVAVAVWPEAWLRLFGNDPVMLATGSAYLRIVGPFYGFFGLGLALYFASQGAGRLLWPVLAGTLRVAIAAGGGWIVLALTGSQTGLFAAIAAGLLAYGVLTGTAIACGAWNRRS